MAKLKFLLKKEIGRRFKRFRETIGKTQMQLAGELKVYQSTITNIEVGKTFPGLKYLHYFHDKYRLNTNWLLSGRGDMFESEEERKPSTVSLLHCHIHKQDAMYKKYAELIDLMQVPVIEQVILAKLVELKVLAKEEINRLRKKEKQETIKLQKA
jgi:transcriptional regulator with XRE-family HTH domain